MISNIDYNTEFSLNIEHQIEKIKEPIQVGYSPEENVVLFTLIIPKKYLSFKLK